MIGVSAGRVSQYISEGKITPAALVGEGPRAKINVRLAQSQLRGRLDPSQRFGMNGLGTSLDAPPAQPPFAAPTPAGDSIDEQIRAQRLRQEQMKSRRMAEEEASRTGRFMLTSAAEEQMAKVAGAMMSAFEGALPDFAGALAAEFGVAQRDIMHVLKVSFRSFRERASRQSAEAAAEMPETVPDESTAPESP
ncbi:hypothetical protein [Xanthobacter sp. 91]|uniref:hypothetical protein n=1 Tax=Xanthobacter sp. 91 TaxID=1117244 RepID=UPI00068BDC20|nr:hypothetical protein [Xanthobacter sp. 91]